MKYQRMPPVLASLLLMAGSDVMWDNGGSSARWQTMFPVN